MCATHIHLGDKNFLGKIFINSLYIKMGGIRIKKNKYIKLGLFVVIATLFIISSITPMTVGYKVEPPQIDSELDELLNNLRFLYVKTEYILNFAHLIQ